jgi:hypothetical protein
VHLEQVRSLYLAGSACPALGTRALHTSAMSSPRHEIDLSMQLSIDAPVRMGSRNGSLESLVPFYVGLTLDKS